MKKISIKIPKGIQYISEWKDYLMPIGEHCIIDKGVTGCGYTEYCLMNNNNIVLCSPRKLLLDNKAEQHLKKNHRNILYLKSLSDEKNVDKKSIGHQILEHIELCKTLNLPIKFLVTYDSVWRVNECLLELGILDDFTFVVDEFQSIFLDSYFKVNVELEFVSQLQNCKSVIYLSATPMLEKYLDRLDEFSSLKMFFLDWSDTGYVEHITIRRRRTNYLSSECSKVIKDYLLNKFPTALDENTGEIVESKEAVFYFNSVTEIIRVIKSNNLTPENTIVICSETENNKKKLNKIGFDFGKIPTEDEPNPMFTFCTSAVYMGVDFYSDCASSFVFADPNVDCLALDISLDLPQIIGRQRNKSNIFKNNIVVFYKTTRKEDPELTEENYFFHRKEKKRRTIEILNGFERLTESQKEIFIDKLKDSIELKQYSNVFVSISKSGKPVYNTLIDIADVRAWEVSQRDYQDNLTVTKALYKAGFGLSTYLDSDDVILKTFLDNKFYRANYFHDRMRLYCEFRDQYNDNERIIEGLEHKIPNPKFHQYYKFYGTSGCSARRYEEGLLEAGWRDKINESGLTKKIYSIFNSGDRVSMADAKRILSEIYSEFQISTKAKATDLEKYFKISKTKVTLPDHSITNGFKLGEKVLK